jgi:hypothetical protein
MTFTDVVQKEIAKSRRMGSTTTFLFIPSKPNSQHMGKYDGAEDVLQAYHDVGHSVKVEPSKTEHAQGNYITISNDPVEEVSNES